MQQQAIHTAAILGMLAAWVGAAPLTASAADNSGVVIVDHRHQSSPFGEYDSRRQTEIYGPSSGYRYEQYRYPPPGVIVYPRDGGYGARGGHGRVIQRYGPGAYGRYGAGAAPAAPRIHGNADRYRDHRRSNARRDGFRAHTDPSRRSLPDRRSQGFGRDPSQRAIEPAQRAIR